jgi:hypothetical protein
MAGYGQITTPDSDNLWPNIRLVQILVDKRFHLYNIAIGGC